MYKLFWILTTVITLMELYDCFAAVRELNKAAFTYHYWKLITGIFMEAGWIICWVKGVI